MWTGLICPSGSPSLKTVFMSTASSSAGTPSSMTVRCPTGFMNPVDGVFANFMPAAAALRPGTVGVVAQSGGINLAIAFLLERAGIGLRRVLIVGGADLGRMVADRIIEHSEMGFRLAGFVDDRAASSDTIGYRGLPVLGTIDLGGVPEQGVSDGQGRLFVVMQDPEGSVTAVDAKTMKAVAHYPFGDKGRCNGLALDVKNRVLFAACAQSGNPPAQPAQPMMAAISVLLTWAVSASPPLSAATSPSTVS